MLGFGLGGGNVPGLTKYLYVTWGWMSDSCLFGGVMELSFGSLVVLSTSTYFLHSDSVATTKTLFAGFSLLGFFAVPYGGLSLYFDSTDGQLVSTSVSDVSVGNATGSIIPVVGRTTPSTLLCAAVVSSELRVFVVARFDFSAK